MGKGGSQKTEEVKLAELAERLANGTDAPLSVQTLNQGRHELIRAWTGEDDHPFLSARVDLDPKADAKTTKPVHLVGDPFIKSGSGSGYIFYKGPAIVVTHDENTGMATALLFVAADHHGVYISEVWRFDVVSGEWKHRNLSQLDKPTAEQRKDLPKWLTEEERMLTIVDSSAAPWENVPASSGPSTAWLKKFKKAITFFCDTVQGDAFPGPAPELLLSAITQPQFLNDLSAAGKRALSAKARALVKPSLMVLNKSLPNPEDSNELRLTGGSTIMNHVGTFTSHAELIRECEAHVPQYAHLANMVFIGSLAAAISSVAAAA